MRITIRVQADMVQHMQPHRGLGAAPPLPSPAAELAEKAVALGLILEPVHPGTTDPQLSTYYTAEVPDRAAAERAAAELRQCRAVEAAYVKPPEALP